VIIAFVRRAAVTHIAEDEEFRLRPEIDGVADAGLLEIGLGAMGDEARIAAVRLAVIGSYTSPTIASVGTSKIGSMNAVLGSSTRIMSDSWISLKPRMDEPSNGTPSSNVSADSTWAGMVECCHTPGRSVNRRSTILTLAAISRTSATLFDIVGGLLSPPGSSYSQTNAATRNAGGVLRYGASLRRLMRLVYYPNGYC
jgi:hypothetical protein